MKIGPLVQKFKWKMCTKTAWWFHKSALFSLKKKSVLNMMWEEVKGTIQKEKYKSIQKKMW